MREGRFLFGCVPVPALYASARCREERLCAGQMAKIAKPIKQLTCNSGFDGRRRAAPQVMVNWKRRDSSAPVAVSVPVKFMDLRPSMCRWPIGDPQHFATFRFCGSACPSEASYCKTHSAIAHTPSRPGTLPKTKFHMRPRIKSRDDSGCAAHAICKAGDRGSRPNTLLKESGIVGECDEAAQCPLYEKLHRIAADHGCSGGFDRDDSGFMPKTCELWKV